MHSGLVISEHSGRPLYLQIMDQVKRFVAVGDWAPGAELPSIRALAAELSISVITVKRAYAELERECVIVTKQGKGTFVSAAKFLPHAEPVRERIEGCVRDAVDLARTLSWGRRDLEGVVDEIWAESAPDPESPGGGRKAVGGISR